MIGSHAVRPSSSLVRLRFSFDLWILTVYRSASAERMVGMSWSEDISRADQFRQRQAWYVPPAIYRTVVAPAAVLALLERKGESPPEAADPKMLTSIEQMEQLHPQRPREYRQRIVRREEASAQQHQYAGGMTVSSGRTG
jgi:hypothetical protein